MKFKILEVKWVGAALQVAFSTSTDDGKEISMREATGWDGQKAIELAKDSKYVDEIRELMKRREMDLDKRPAIDITMIGKEFNSKEE